VPDRNHRPGGSTAITQQQLVKRKRTRSTGIRRRRQSKLRKRALRLGNSRACDKIAVAAPDGMRTWIVFAALAACTDHANPGGDDDAPVDASPGGQTWTGTSHVVHAYGAIYDNTFTFAVDTTSTHDTQLIVQSGQVHITKQPPSSGDCTITIEASHPIGPRDGHMTIDETDLVNPTIVGGQGTTVWLAVYTLVCPSGTQTTMMPYSIDWWPLPTGGAPTPVVAVDAMATITVSNPGETGTIMIARESP
jgi:hypothetical protein